MQIPDGPYFRSPVKASDSIKETKKVKRGSMSERGRTKSTKYNSFELSTKMKKIAECFDVKQGKANCLCGGYTPKMSSFNKHPLRASSPERDHCACKDNSITPYGRVGRPASAPKKSSYTQRSGNSPKRGQAPPSDRKAFLTKFEEEVLSKDFPTVKSPSKILWELDQSSNIHNLTLQ